MIRPRDPQRRISLHAVIADHQILHAHEHGMTDVQLTGHVRRRDGDHERLDLRVEIWLVRVVVRLEESTLLPQRIDARLGGFEIVRLRQFLLCHSFSLSPNPTRDWSIYWLLNKNASSIQRTKHSSVVPPQFVDRSTHSNRCNGLPVPVYSHSISSAGKSDDFSDELLRRLPPCISFSIRLPAAYYF